MIQFSIANALTSLLQFQFFEEKDACSFRPHKLDYLT